MVHRIRSIAVIAGTTRSIVAIVVPCSLHVLPVAAGSSFLFCILSSRLSGAAAPTRLAAFAQHA